MNKYKPLHRWAALLLSVLMMFSLAIPAAAAGVSTEAPEKVSAPSIVDDGIVTEEVTNPNEEVRVSIVLDKASTIAQGYSTANIVNNASAMNYRDSLRTQQAAVQSAIEKKLGKELDVQWNLTLAANIISAYVRRGDIAAIASVSGVKEVVEETQYSPAVVSVGGTVQPNMASSSVMTGATSAWDLGVTGKGSLVAIIDTGLDYEHISFDNDAFLASIDNDTSVLKLTKDKLTPAVLNQLNAKNGSKGTSTLTADQLYVSDKIPFGYNYVDGGTRIDHKDAQGEHGSHVAGIATANRLVEKDGEFVDAVSTVHVAGNAPDAQVMVMKVFGSRGGAYDSDYFAALEDAMILGADSANLSLGGSSAGMTSSTYQSILDALTENGTLMITSAGNNSSWGENSSVGNLYKDDVNYATGGSPGTYGNTLSVASVDNIGFTGYYIQTGDAVIGYGENLYANGPMTSLADQGDLDFIYLDNPDSANATYSQLGTVISALGDEIDGKVFLFNRVSTGQAYVAQYAVNAGAIATIIVDFEDTLNSFNVGTGYDSEEPIINIRQSHGEYFRTDDSGTTTVDNTTYTYYNGTMTVGADLSHIPDIRPAGSSTFAMSPFSSWGIPGNLTLKPEISAPGGSIYSVYGANDDTGMQDHDQYELMSGTSMAAPQVSGITALVQQHLRDLEIENKDGSYYTLSNSLLMGTAVPMKDANGNYYSLLQQGAGIANAAAAVTTPVYITMSGRTDGKVKAEVGDDPTRAGVYTVEFTLNNLTDNVLTYAFDADVFTQAIEGEYMLTSTQSVDADVQFSTEGGPILVPVLHYDFNGDGQYTEADAQLLLDSIIKGEEITNFTEDMDVNGDGKVDTYDVHELLNADLPVLELQPGETTVTATITLDAAAAAALDAEKDGTGFYVEAYIFATPEAGEDDVLAPELSIPVLGYYGSWTDPSMFDNDGDYLGVNTGLRVGNSVRTGDTVTLEAGQTVGGYTYSLIRNAGARAAVLKYTLNGETVTTLLNSSTGSYSAAYYNSSSGRWSSTSTNYSFSWNPNTLPAGATDVSISAVAIPEYYKNEQGTYDIAALIDGDLSNGELGKGAYQTTNIIVPTTEPTPTPQPTQEPDDPEPPVEDDDKLNAIVWDDDIYWSEFDPTDVENWQPVEGNVSPLTYGAMPVTAAWGSDNTLYAASLDDDGDDDFISTLYSVNTDTFALTEVGTSEIFYADMADSFSLGDNVALGVYYNYVVMIDTATGDYLGAWSYLSDAALSSIAYVYSFTNTYYNAPVDVYYLIDWDGNVYQEAFISFDGGYYYFLGAEDGLIGNVGTDSDAIYNSAYWDGSHLYWSRLDYTELVQELYAINITEDDEYIYFNGATQLGTFPTDVWPVSGLTDFDGPRYEMLSNAALANSIATAQVSVDHVSTTDLAPVTLTSKAASTPVGTLNNIEVEEGEAANGVVIDKEAHTVTIPVSAQDSTNGEFKLTYDTSALTLTSTTYASGILTSGKETAGEIHVGYAAKDAFTGVVLTAVFSYDESFNNVTTVTLTVSQDGSDTTGSTQTITLDLTNPEPTPEPTEEPTPEPTEEPTPEPSEEPTPEPSEEPTPEPTPDLFEDPTPAPTEAPTQAPSTSGSDTTIPATGDNLNLTVLVVLAFVSMVGMSTLLVVRKRND